MAHVGRIVRRIVAWRHRSSWICESRPAEFNYGLTSRKNPVVSTGTQLVEVKSGLN